MNLFRKLFVGLLVLVSLALPINGRAQDATPVSVPAAFSSFPRVDISYADGVYSDVAPVAAGRVLVTATLPANAEDPAALVLIKVDDTVQAWLDAESTLETHEGELPDWWFSATMVGIAINGPQSHSVVDLTLGTWFFGTYPAILDYSAPFEVTGEMPTDLPSVAPDISIMGVDYAFGGAGQVLPSGPQVLEFMNMGAEPHELVILSVPKKLTAAQWMTAFGDLSAGEEATPSPATGLTMDDLMAMSIKVGVPALSAGQTIWTQIDLAPGEYLAICYLSTSEGGWHPMLGMLTPFTVE